MSNQHPVFAASLLTAATLVCAAFGILSGCNESAPGQTGRASPNGAADDAAPNGNATSLIPGSPEDIAATNAAATAATEHNNAPELDGSTDSTADETQLVIPEDRTVTVVLTFDNIKFEMEKGEEFKRTMLTQDIRKLHKHMIRIKGFIKPGDRTTGLTSFVFVRDDRECCFGPGAALFDCILVSLEKGETTDFSTRPVFVEGIFYVREYKGPNGQIWAVFNMKDGKVN